MPVSHRDPRRAQIPYKDRDSEIDLCDMPVPPHAETHVPQITTTPVVFCRRAQGRGDKLTGHTDPSLENLTSFTKQIHTPSRHFVSLDDFISVTTTLCWLAACKAQPTSKAHLMSSERTCVAISNHTPVSNNNCWLGFTRDYGLSPRSEGL